MYKFIDSENKTIYLHIEKINLESYKFHIRIDFENGGSYYYPVLGPSQIHWDYFSDKMSLLISDEVKSFCERVIKYYIFG